MTTADTKGKWLGRALAAGLTALCLAPMISRWGLYTDEGNLLHVSDRIRAGQVPYQDFLLSQPPGHYCLFTLLQILFGNGLYASRVAGIVVLSLLACAVAETVQHQLGGIRSGLVGAFTTVSAYHSEVTFNYYYTCALADLFALVLVLRTADGASKIRLGIAGTLATMGVLIKSNAGAYGAVGVFLTVLIVPSADGADVVRRLSRLLTGVFVGLVLGYVALRSLGIPWMACWQSQFTPFFLTTDYIRFAFPGPKQCFPRVLSWETASRAFVNCFVFYLPLVVLAGAWLDQGVRWWKQGRMDRRSLAVVVFASTWWLVCWPFFVRGYMNHVLPLPYALGMIGASKWCARGSWSRQVVIGVGVAFLLLFFLREDVLRYHRNNSPCEGRLSGICLMPRTSRYYSAVTEAVRSRLRPGDDLFVAPYAEMLYALAERPCRCLIPGLVRDRASEILAADELKRVRPRVVVFEPGNQEVAGVREQATEFMGELHREYSLDAMVDETEIWLRK